MGPQTRKTVTTGAEGEPTSGREPASSDAFGMPEAAGPRAAGEALRGPVDPAGGKSEPTPVAAAESGGETAPGPAAERQTGRTRAGPGMDVAAGVLRAKIQARIVYPDEAVRRGEQGDVLLRIRIGSGGVPVEIGIVRSSGAALLDDAARRGVVRAAPLPGAPGWVEVPVRFRLR